MKYLIALPVKKHPREEKRKKGPLLVLGSGAVPQEANNYSSGCGLAWQKGG